METAYIIYSIILPLLILAAAHLSLARFQLEFLHAAALMLLATILMPVVSVASLYTLSALSEASGAALSYADSNIWIYLPGPLLGGMASLILLYHRGTRQ